MFDQTYPIGIGRTRKAFVEPIVGKCPHPNGTLELAIAVGVLGHGIGNVSEFKLMQIATFSDCIKIYGPNA